jgi:hypothetical protein
MRHRLETLETRLLLTARPMDPVLPSGHEVEPNDTIETATPLEPLAVPAVCRAELNGFICPVGAFRGDGRLGGTAAETDIDYFTFPAPANSRVSVDIVGPAVTHGVSFELVDASGNTLARTVLRDRDNDGVADTASIEYSPDSAADLYIRADGDGSVIPAEGLEYRINASIRLEYVDRNVEHEPNDTFDTANDIPIAARLPILTTVSNLIGLVPIESFGSIRGELGNGRSALDTDFFRFRAADSVDVDVRVTGAGGESGHLTIYDVDHQVVVEGDHDAQGAFSVHFESGGEGPYFAQLTDQGTVVCITTPCRTYSLEIRERAHPVNPFQEHEPNDALDTANPIELHLAIPRCELVCPVTNATEPGAAPDSGGDASTGDAVDDPMIRLLDARQSGFIAGHAADGDVDFFSVAIQAEHHSRVTLTGPLARVGGAIALSASDGTQLAADSDPSDGLSLEWDTEEASTFYVSVTNTEAGASATTQCEPTAAGICRDATSYRLDVVSGHIRNPIEGRGEQEPNDTFETANTLELRTLPTPVRGIVIRGADARGLAGGPTSDQDVFRFDVRAGEHVSVDVQGLVRGIPIPCPLDVWLNEHNLNEFGDAAGTVYRRGAPAGIDDALERIRYILANHPEIVLGHFEVTVYDADGNAVGSTRTGELGAVKFDAAADGTYFAVVQAIDSTIVEPAAPYRIGVLARSRSGNSPQDPGDTPSEPPGGDNPAVVVIHAGEKFRFVDGDGDAIQILLRGRGGEATITFEGSEPDGSDIASVEVVGVRRGGNLSIQTVQTIQTGGSAEVGSIEIRGIASNSRRRGSRADAFGAIRVDGNVGIVSSNMNVRSLIVDGMLGEIAAPGQQIRDLHANQFDNAMADVGSIRSIDVDEEASDSMFESLLPWEPPAE